MGCGAGVVWSPLFGPASAPTASHRMHIGEQTRRTRRGRRSGGCANRQLCKRGEGIRLREVVDQHMGIGGQAFTAQGQLLGAIAIDPSLIGLIGEGMMLAGGPHLRERVRPGSSFRVALALWRAGKQLWIKARSVVLPGFARRHGERRERPGCAALERRDALGPLHGAVPRNRSRLRLLHQGYVFRQRRP